MDRRPIVISGIPRSGSSWVGRVLSQASNTQYIHEPDNEKKKIIPLLLKKNVHRFPAFEGGMKDSFYYLLWKKSLLGGYSNFSKLVTLIFKPKSNYENYIKYKCNNHFNDIYSIADSLLLSILGKIIHISLFWKRAKRRVIVKSVHSVLSIDWLMNTFNIRLVVLVRHPANVIASYLKMNMSDADREVKVPEIGQNHIKEYIMERNLRDDKLGRMAIQVCSFYKYIELMTNKHSQIKLIKHEDLCQDPVGKFKDLFSYLNLNWSKKVEDFLNEKNRLGDGYKISRIASKEADKYKKNLSLEQIKKIEEICLNFNLELYRNF